MKLITLGSERSLVSDRGMQRKLFILSLYLYDSGKVSQVEDVMRLGRCRQEAADGLRVHSGDGTDDDL